MGVFATRSPNRPNPIGLSSVKLLEIKKTAEYGSVLVVEGADLMDGTTILDVKPYVPYSDLHVEATGGFTDTNKLKRLTVEFSAEMPKKMTSEQKEELASVLSEDPRPAYQNDENREYGLDYGEFSVKFKVKDGVLTVTSVTEA